MPGTPNSTAAGKFALNFCCDMIWSKQKALSLLNRGNRAVQDSDMLGAVMLNELPWLFLHKWLWYITSHHGLQNWP